MRSDVISHTSTIFMYEVLGRLSDTETNIVASTFDFLSTIFIFLQHPSYQHTCKVDSNNSLKKERFEEICGI